MTAISIQNVSKIYNLYDKPVDRLKESLSISKRVYHKKFAALDSISVDIPRNQSIGIIGTNGSGKSTLLKIICGVLTPTSGNIQVNGRISALLELGAGFNSEYTGLENIYLNGTLMGYERREIEDRVKSITEFADIGDFINQPVKTYSSGMFARLAFAVSINVDPDILIVDEALSVGDIRFQQKCFRKIEELKKHSTVLMVSHDMAAISKFCDSVLWIEKGKMQAFGPPRDIIKQYQAYLMESKLSTGKTPPTASKTGTKQRIKLQAVTDNHQSYGNKSSLITRFGLFDAETMEPVEYVSGGQSVKFYIEANHIIFGENLLVGVTVTDRLGNNLFGINNYLSSENLDSDNETVLYSCQFSLPDLNSGPYTISPAIAEGSQSEHIMRHWVFDACTFQMLNSFPENPPGILAPRNFSFQIENEEIF